MAGEPSSHDLTATPRYYPLALSANGDSIDFVALDEADYAAASFLDARMLRPGMAGIRQPWTWVRDEVAAIPLRCHFIFHISHVGSTLLSRLLGHHPAVFSLREPVLLRALAERHLGFDSSACENSATSLEEQLTVLLGLWSRTYRPGQVTLLKTTSYVSEMAELLMSRVPAARSIFLFVSPVTFLKALLDGAMSDIDGQAERRLFRLHRQLGGVVWRLDRLSDGERVVMGWLSEMFALQSASASFPTRVLWLDFDRFLRSPADGLLTSLRHLGSDSDEPTVGAILASPDLARYAKAPAHAYDARTRQSLLEQSERKHLPEIRRGMAWLERAAELPPVRGLLESAAAAATRPFG